MGGSVYGDKKARGAPRKKGAEEKSLEWEKQLSTAGGQTISKCSDSQHQHLVCA